MLLKPEGYQSDNVPLMLRSGALEPRPSFDKGYLQTRFGNAPVCHVTDVQELTGQNREEVIVDLMARRLRAYRSFQMPRWRISITQFEDDFAASCY
jgi:hypothetical protein